MELQSIHLRLKKPLFNYPSFIKTLNTFRVELHIVNWINNSSYINTKSKNQDELTFLCGYTENSSLNIKNTLLNSKDILDFICISLFKLFINNNVSLNNLNIRIDYYNHFSFEICKIIRNLYQILKSLQLIFMI